MKKPSILVLNGGGMRGPLHVGALQRLSEEYQEEYLYKIFYDGIYGISVGAIIGSLVAFGFSIQDFSDILSEFMNIHKVFDPLRLNVFLKMNDRRGIDNGNKLFEILSNIFSRKNIDLSSVKIEDALVPLKIIASDLTNLKAVTFTGKTRLWSALRASFALPIVFTPYTLCGNTYVDGAILCENITWAVPREDIHKSMILLCYKNSQEDYVSFLMNCRQNREIEKIKRKYPENVCCLVENTIPLFFFQNIEENMHVLQNTGYSCMNAYLDSVPRAETKNSLNTDNLAGPS